MGSSNSRLGQRSSRPRSNRSVKRILRSFVCGSSSSSSDVPIHEMEDYRVELLSRSAEWHEPIVVDRLQSSTKECSSIICLENDCSCFTTESGTLSDRSCSTSEAHSIECSSKYAEIGNTEKCLSKRKESVPDLLDIAYSPSEPYLEKTGDISCSSSTGQRDIHKEQHDVGCCSSEGQQSLHSEFVQEGSSSDAAAKVSDSVHESGSEIGQERGCSSNMSTENLSNSVVGVHGADSSSVPVDTNPLVTSIQTQDYIVQEAAPPSPGHVMPDTLQDRGNGSILHVDVVSISSNTFFSSTGEISNREVRRNSRRLFWDAFSRRSSRRHSDSQTIFLSSEDPDDLGSHDRWLLDLSGDLFEDGAGSDTGYPGNRGHGMYQGRWHSRSEIWERLRGGFEESGRRASFCASGLHPYGSCSCESFLMAEESGTHGSISRIVMLAEALFEVLDEIHRQPVSVSLSMVTLPAPESVVDSFPLKNHKKPSAAENGDAEQCYICLAEYEEGDKIRVLPCHHEYHMLCVDKWLKEIHGVCPLCRGDVCEGAVEGPILSP